MRAKPAIALALILLIPTLALAQSQADQPTTQSRLIMLFWSSLPLVIVAVIIFLMIRFATSGKRANKYDDYRDRHLQHMQRVEQTLEQIRQALEKRP